MKTAAKYASILLLDLTGIILIGAQWKPLGWVILGLGVLMLTFVDKKLRKDLALIYGSLALLGLTPITTDISYTHMIVMGIFLTLAVGIPYAVSRLVFKNNAVRFQMHHGRRWYRTEIAYIGVTLVVSYLLLPFMLRETGAYLNWTVDPGFSTVVRLFIGTN